MKSIAWRAFSLLTILACSVTFAADDAAAPAKPADPAVKKAPTKPAGQLPPFYGKVVDDALKVKIYAVQAKYREQLDVLTKQIVELKAKRDAELESMLSPEQLAKVKALKAESDAKKAAKAAADAEAKKAAAAAAGATPPATPAPAPEKKPAGGAAPSTTPPAATTKAPATSAVPATK